MVMLWGLARADSTQIEKAALFYVGESLKVSVFRNEFTAATVPTSVPAKGLPGWYSCSLV